MGIFGSDGAGGSKLLMEQQKRKGIALKTGGRMGEGRIRLLKKEDGKIRLHTKVIVSQLVSVYFNDEIYTCL